MFYPNGLLSKGLLKGSLEGVFLVSPLGSGFPTVIMTRLIELSRSILLTTGLVYSLRVRFIFYFLTAKILLILNILKVKQLNSFYNSIFI